MGFAGDILTRFLALGLLSLGVRLRLLNLESNRSATE